jgi:NAD(P)-dependent dehydrogenase (short-subunit alcohol dehydrogenase family)
MHRNQKPAVIITGAARGIGRGIAARLLAAGWNVLVADVLVKEGKKTVRELNDEFGGIRGNGGRAVFARCDVTVEKQIAAVVARAVAEFGRLDGLVNNAGIAYPYNAPLEKFALADWSRLIAVNLTGPFLCAKHAAPYLRRAPGGGAIVNISSTRALQAEPHTEAYGASKAGLLGLTRSLAVSLGPKVRANAICPGWIDPRSATAIAAAAKAEKHNQHPAGRVGRPADIAALTLFLLDSAQSGFITGQTFVCDGGMTVKMIYED